jgi:hypothetical protein
MSPLYQPKWRKFLSLKSQRNILPDEPTASTQSNDSVQHTDAATIESIVVEAVTPQKKRKRSEEEIALRKAKKLKSKNKEGQEWEQLTDFHQNQQLSQPKVPPIQEISEPKIEESHKDQTTAVPDSTKAAAALLSTKAKEIAKARKDEKSQEKQKGPKKVVGENTGLDRKASQVFAYLEQYQAHVDNGSEWKFKKQHQNWIVKHLYSYPWKSDDLLIQYLKTVQGQARTRLIEGARKVKDENEGVYGEDIIRRAEDIILALKE